MGEGDGLVTIPTEAIKQFIVGTIVPAIAGAGAAYLASKGVLNVFDISKATATTDLDELGVFLVVTGSGWLTSHHLLSGHYSPAAKVGIRGVPPAFAPSTNPTKMSTASMFGEVKPIDFTPLAPAFEEIKASIDRLGKMVAPKGANEEAHK